MRHAVRLLAAIHTDDHLGNFHPFYPSLPCPFSARAVSAAALAKTPAGIANPAMHTHT